MKPTEDTQTQTFQHFKFTLPILKTRTAIVKDAEGKDIEKRYVQGVASSTDLDLHGDRMDPSAIETMAETLKFHVIRLNAEHDTSWQSELGDISKLDVSDDSRLLIEAELNDMSKSKDLWYALTELNKKLGLSIGGYVKEYVMVKEEFKNEESGEMDTRWVRHYKNIELDHIAVTSSPANPKTWVGAIAKSIQEDSELLIEKLEDKTEEAIKETVALKSQENVEIETKKEKKLREIARNIVRAIQNLEADLLLELTYAGLNILSESQVKLLDTLLIERNKSMKKDVSLEAEEALKKDEAAVKPEDEKAETEATPENESKEEATPKEEPKVEGEETETPAEPAAPAEEKPAEEKPVESEPAEEPKEESETEVKSEKAAPKDGDACTLPDGSKGTIKGGKCVAEAAKSEESSGNEDAEDKKEGEEEAEPASPEGKPEDAEKEESEEKPEDKTEDKSAPEAAELLKSIQTLTDGMKKVLETNETLAKRVEELEKQPASRKTIELEKGVGDDDSEPVDAKSLKEEMDEKIAKIRKDNYGSPNLFAMIQKVRAEYSKKVSG